jgi:hypothetical protein
MKIHAQGWPAEVSFEGYTSWRNRILCLSQGISELLFVILHPHPPRSLLDTPHQLSEIAALDPLLFSAAAYSKPPSSSASAADTPALANFANNPCRLTANHGASCNDHVCGHHGVWQNLDVLFDHREGVNSDIVADVDMR